jgi:hypothetical protein
VASKNVKPDKMSKDDLYTEFMNCVQKTVNSTNNGKVNLKWVKAHNGRGEYIRITQEGKERDKLPLVFDIILQGYYDYVKELWWIYEDDTKFNKDPVCIDAIVQLNVQPKDKLVYIVDGKGKNYGVKYGTDHTIFNQKFLKSLVKKFHRDFNGTDLPQFPQFQELINKPDIYVNDCEDMINKSVSEKPGEISPGDAGQIDGWDVGKACGYLISHAHQSTTYNCAVYVERAIAAGGGPLSQKMACGSKPRDKAATNLRYANILRNNGFIMIDSEEKSGNIPPYGSPKIELQAGDVAIIGAANSGRFHAAMYTSSRGWVSDFFQKSMNPYPSSMPYAVYRFRNKKKV